MEVAVTHVDLELPRSVQARRRHRTDPSSRDVASVASVVRYGASAHALNMTARGYAVTYKELYNAMDAWCGTRPSMFCYDITVIKVGCDFCPHRQSI